MYMFYTGHWHVELCWWSVISWAREWWRCCHYSCWGWPAVPSTPSVPTPSGKSWIFYWKFQDLESPGKSLWSWKVFMHFS